jgi:glycosyltransferase involved in cell wall biosynthesis
VSASTARDAGGSLGGRTGRSERGARVLFVVPTVERAAGGPTHTLAEYLGALARAGVETTVATTRPSGDDLRWLLERAPGTVVRAFGSLGRAAFRTSPALLAWVAKRAPAFDAVHVFGTLNPISSIAARLSVRRGVPTVVCALGTVSDYTFGHRRAMLKRAWWALLDRPTLRRALLHVESPAELREAVRRNPELEGRVVTVMPPFRPQPDEPRERRAGAVLFLSRLHPKKNIESLLHAWPAVVESHPRATLVVAGSGDDDYVERLRTIAEGVSGEGEPVRFVGFVHGEEKRELLRTSSVFVLPSHRENFGLAAVEAAAAGLPSVLSRNVDAGDILEEEGLAVRCDVTPPSIAQGIGAVLSDAALRRRCERAGPAAVARRFAPEVVARSLVALYGRAGSPRLAELARTAPAAGDLG